MSVIYTKPARALHDLPIMRCFYFLLLICLISNLSIPALAIDDVPINGTCPAALLISDTEDHEIELKAFLQKWNVSPERITGKKQPTSGAPRKLLNGSIEQRAARAWVNKKVKASEVPGRVLFNKPLAKNLPDAPIFHWASSSKIEYVDMGFPEQQLKFWTKKSRAIELGLYGASHPVSSVGYGDILMEVVLYTESFPDRNKLGELEIHPVENHFFNRDKLGEDWDSRYLSDHYDLNHNYFYVYDLSAIKHIKWPEKELILGIWEKLNIDFTPKEHQSEMAKAAIQWALTPNYSVKEKGQIFLKNPTKFAKLSSFFTAEHNIGYPVTNKEISRDFLFKNSILKVVLNSENDLIDASTLSPNLQEMYTAFHALSPKGKKALEQFIEYSNREDRVILFLKLISDIDGATTTASAFVDLKKFYDDYEKEKSSYSYFKPALLKDEVDLVKNFIKLTRDKH